MTYTDDQQRRFSFLVDDNDDTLLKRRYRHDFILGGIDNPGHLMMVQEYPDWKGAYQNTVFSNLRIER